MHIFSGKKELIRSHFISLLTSIKSQCPRATDHCIHARVCRIDKTCYEIKQKQKIKKSKDSFIIFFFISMFIHGYNALSCHFLNTPKISLPVSLLGPPPLSFWIRTFCIHNFCHYIHRPSTYTFTFYAFNT